MFCAKNRLRKHQIFDKWDDFENRPSCKGYSLGKMVSLGQKLKFRKTCEKRFFNHIRVVLCKNRLRKHQIFDKWDDFENRPSCKGYSLGKMVKFSVRSWKNDSLITLELFCAKFEKTPNIRKILKCEKRFFNHIRVVLCKNRLRKHQIFDKWDDFENRPSCKGYSLGKMVSLGQKLKFRKTSKNAH